MAKKFLYIFDFDDTLATTDSNVIVRNKTTGEETRLNSEEYAKQASALKSQEDSGEIEFDFREFSDIPGAELIQERFSILNGVLSKHGNKAVKILTARPKKAEKAIHDFIQYNTGNSIDVVAGAHYPIDKAMQIIMWINEYNPADKLSVIFYDDSAANIQKSIDIIETERKNDPERFRNVEFYAHKVEAPHKGIKENALFLRALEAIYKKLRD